MNMHLNHCFLFKPGVCGQIVLSANVGVCVHVCVSAPEAINNMSCERHA